MNDCEIRHNRRTAQVAFIATCCGMILGCGTPNSPTPQRLEPNRVTQPNSSDQQSEINDDPAPVASGTNAFDDSPGFRREQPDPSLNSERLAAAGIHMLQSDRLVLLTDRDPATVKDLPALADALFDHLAQACGPLRPTKQGTEFQAIGCLMSDISRFESAGLIDAEATTMRHGQQWGYRFWVRDQKENYYRRHLVLHEFVHVYMTVDTPDNDLLDQWFMEAAAELYATHRTTSAGAEFAVMPRQFAGFEGWGRISAIKRRRIDLPGENGDVQPLPSLEAVLSGKEGKQNHDANYRWWWALGWLLNHHPEYSDDWDRLCLSRSQSEFTTRFASFMSAKRNRLNTDWMLFCESLCEGFDSTHSFGQHTVDGTSPVEVQVRADQGWQDTGLTTAPGDQLHISSSGRCLLNETTVPWESEPNGITLEYNQGRPIGELIAVIVDSMNCTVSQRIRIAKDWQWESTMSGRIWLQINDSENDRANNSGEYVAQVRCE